MSILYGKKWRTIFRIKAERERRKGRETCNGEKTDIKMYQQDKNDKKKLIPCASVAEFISSWEQHYWMACEDDDYEIRRKIEISEVWDGEISTPIKKSASINLTFESVEKSIEMILDKGIKNECDVVKILAWKLGKIDMAGTKRNNTLKFYKGWDKSLDELAEMDKVSGGYGGEINLQAICKDIVSAKEALKQYKNYKSEELKSFFKNHYEDKKKRQDIYGGIGLVYLITLLHFMTRGGVPIYDRFVHIALKALHGGIEPGKYVYYVAPVKYDYKTYLALMDEYTWLMKETILPYGKHYIVKMKILT